MRLSFNLPEINRKKTRERVESALEKYKIMLLMNPEELEPQITSSFKLVPHTQTNEFNSSTENVAIEKIYKEAEKNKYIKKIIRAVNRLNYQEREVIVKRYLSGEMKYDYEVYNELGYSESKYYRIKADAFYKLAFMLRIVVYKEDSEDECCTANP